MKVGIDPSINRFLAGLGMMADGIRTILGAVSPDEVNGALQALQGRTQAAFEETAKFEAAVAFVFHVQVAQHGAYTDEQKSDYEQALKTIADRLPVTKQG